MNHSASTRLFGRVRTTFAITIALIAASVAFVPAANAASPDGDPFYTTAELCKLTLTPTAADVPVNGTQTLTAKLESTGVQPPLQLGDGEQEPAPACWEPLYWDSLALSDLPTVTFNLHSGPNAPASASVPLDESWTATHTYSSANAGTDNWDASVELYNYCVADWEELESWDGQPVPPECVNRVECAPGGILDYDCDDEQSCEGTCEASARTLDQNTTVILQSNASAITWVAPPPPPVVIQRDPTVSIASSNRCHTKNKFRIRPSTANGQVASMKLYVDGKRVKTVKGSSEAFTINGKKYRAGSHSIKLVTTFTDGKVVTTTKTFNRCRARTVVKRRSPRFTG